MVKITMNLEQFTIFSELDAASLSRLGAISRSTVVKKGGIIFSDGDEANSLHCLVSGRVDLVKSSPDGKEQVVRSVGGGEIFAEAAVFAGKHYPATAIAKERSELIVIDKKRFVEFISSHPGVSLKMMGAMAALLRHLNSLLGDLKLASAESRLAAYLYHLSRELGSDDLALPLKKNELAARLGTTSETLSRNLAKLKRAGAIKVDGRRIRIKDIETLRESANI